MAGKIRLQYVGSYGKRHFPAFIPNVGTVYHSEILNLDFLEEEDTKEADQPVTRWKVIGPKGSIAILTSNEWRRLKNFCSYQLMTGEFCNQSAIPGDDFCEFHAKLGAE
jgi:hypothetical protein